MKLKPGGQVDELRTAQSALPEADHLALAINEARDGVAAARMNSAEARGAHSDIAREARVREERLEEIAREQSLWSERAKTATSRIAALKTRLEQTEQDRSRAENAPGEIEEKAQSSSRSNKQGRNAPQ